MSSEPPTASASATIVTSHRPRGNGLAVAGFVLSLVALIPIPFWGIIPWILAVTFSSIGLSRANNHGLPHRGLAIAGLCISLGALLVVILAIASCVAVVSAA